MELRSKLSGVSSSRKYVPFKAEGTTGTVQYPVRFAYEALTLYFLHCVLGYWSSGTRLVDSAKIAGQGIEMGELPEYMVVFHSLNALVLLRPNKPVWWCSFESPACLAPALQT